jgi:selenocysteine lyase/cysteine desulfurase
MIPALVPSSDFLDLAGVTHLYTAAECPMLRRAHDAINDYCRQKSRAEEGRRCHVTVTAACKEELAALVGGQADDIALLGSASDAINAVAGVIDAGPGDNIVINDLEFPSVALPWLRLKARGVEVRVVHHQDWTIPAGHLLAAVDARTKLVALSHVSYVNGWQHDVAAIQAGLRGSSARLLLDVTQSLGVLPVESGWADFLVSSTYKWLLGTHGLGILIVNEPAAYDPVGIGWYSTSETFAEDRYERYDLRGGAGRFETGYLSFPAIYALRASLPYLMEAAIERIAGHAHQLGDRLIAGLRRLDLEVITPDDHARRGASVSFLHREAAELGPKLATRDVHVWAGDGRVRASTHLFNSSADVDRYLDVLSRLT